MRKYSDIATSLGFIISIAADGTEDEPLDDPYL
jgi:hypothetical protein